MLGDWFWFWFWFWFCVADVLSDCKAEVQRILSAVSWNLRVIARE